MRSVGVSASTSPERGGRPAILAWRSLAVADLARRAIDWRAQFQTDAGLRSTDQGELNGRSKKTPG